MVILKHIDINIHFVRDHIHTGFLQVHHVHSKHQVIDLFNKALLDYLYRKSHLQADPT